MKIEKPLVIFEMANNHMGKVSHAKNIIDKYFKLSKNYNDKINFAIKFQYRDSKTFIHESVLDTNDKHIKRFKTTFLSEKTWKEIISYSKKKFITICTPFDELSVAKVVKDKFDYLKIASCSSTDWPLVEEIVKKAKNKKIICSLGGLNENEISNVISFFTSKKIKINFLYCVANYPTEKSELNLNYFKELKKIYGDKIKGISFHEKPDEFLSGALGFAMGAKIFEKHVGLKTKKIELNKYSTDLHQMDKWLYHLYQSVIMMGSVSGRNKNIKSELSQLNNFKRGVYFKKNRKFVKNSFLNLKNLSINFPAKSGQLTANELSKFSKFKVKKNINESEVSVLKKNLKIENPRLKILEIRNKIRNIVAKSNLVIPNLSKIEISHHYGLKNFYKYGLCMITIINQIYCKKYLFLLNNQKHPAQFHKIKQETFRLVYGKIELNLKIKNKRLKKILKPGDIYTIRRGEVHDFKGISSKGSVIEELSTKSMPEDSYYIDQKVTKNKDRKSFILFN